MAILRDKLKPLVNQSAAGNPSQLTETTVEEQQKQLGLPNSPSTPMGAGMIGAGPNSSKMIGSSQIQKNAGLRDTLQNAQRLAPEQSAQPGSAQTDEKAELEKLNQLTPRVQAAANQIIAQTAQPGSIPSGTLTSDNKDINFFLKDLGNPTNLDNLIKTVGVDQAADYLANDNKLTDQAKSELAKQFNIPDIIGQSLAKNLPENITVQQLDLKQLGYNDNNELASLLGVPVEKLNGLTIKQLGQAVQDKITANYSQSNQLISQINDVNLGPAERAAARKQLKELGVSGVRGVESDLDKLADSMENADQLKFMGQTMPIEQVLDDENVSGMAANYFNDPVFKESLKKTEPELSKFFDNYESVLKSEINQIDERIVTDSKIRFDNNKLASTPVGEIKPDIMEKLVPGYKTARAPVTPPAVVSMLNNSDSYNDQQKTSLLQALNTAGQAGPEALDYIKTLTPTQIANMGLLDSQSSGFKDFTNSLLTSKQIKSIPDYQVDPNNAVDQASRAIGFQSNQELMNVIGNLQDIVSQGYGQIPAEFKSLANLLPVDRPINEWSAEDYNKFVSNLKSNYSQVNGQKVPDFKALADGLKTNLSNVNSTSLFPVLKAGGALITEGPNKGKFNMSSLKNMIGRNELTVDQILNDKTTADKLSSDETYNLIKTYVAPKVKNQVNQLISNHLNGQDINKINKTFANPGIFINKNDRNQFVENINKVISNIEQLANTEISPAKRQTYQLYQKELTDKLAKFNQSNEQFNPNQLNNNLSNSIREALNSNPTASFNNLGLPVQETQEPTAFNTSVNQFGV